MHLQRSLFSQVGSPQPCSYYHLSVNHVKQQLTDNDTMPQKATQSQQNQLRELIKVAKGKLVLIVLDDMWSREHAGPFDCIDMTTSSKFLITTRYGAAGMFARTDLLFISLRIKGIMDKGAEVVGGTSAPLVHSYRCFAPYRSSVLLFVCLCIAGA